MYISVLYIYFVHLTKKSQIGGGMKNDNQLAFVAYKSANS